MNYIYLQRAEYVKCMITGSIQQENSEWL